MASLTIPPLTQQSSISKARRFRIYVDGLPRRDLAVISWTQSTAPDFDSAIITLCKTGASSGDGSFDVLAELPAVGSEVLIQTQSDPVEAELLGTVVSLNLDYNNEAGSSPTATVAHHLVSAFGHTISSRWQAQAGQAAEIPNSRAVFNSNQSNLVSDGTVTINGRKGRLFSSETTARRWSVADGLGYLLSSEAPGEIIAPSQGELDGLAGGIDLGRMNITGMSVLDAMVKIAKRGGLGLRPSHTGFGLVVYRVGGPGRVQNVRLQPAGEKLTPDKTNLWRGAISFKRRPSLRGVLALGQRKQYESTFNLSKGWDTSLETSRWRDFTRSQSPDWPGLSDVYRKWVLNEHSQYGQSPWNLSTYNLSSLDSDDFLINAPRSFQPCISCDWTGASLGIIAEFRLDSSSSWQRWTGPMWSSGDECSISLTGDSLPSQYFQAAVAGTIEVRVTATIISDVKLSAEVTGDAGNIRQVIDLADRAAYRKVLPSSAFYQHPSLPSAPQRDDTNMLNGIAWRLSSIISTGSEAELILGSVDTSYRVGDIVTQIDGRNFELGSNTYTKPSILSVRHDLADKQTTTLIVGG